MGILVLFSFILEFFHIGLKVLGSSDLGQHSEVQDVETRQTIKLVDKGLIEVIDVPEYIHSYVYTPSRRRSLIIENSILFFIFSS